MSALDAQDGPSSAEPSELWLSAYMDGELSAEHAQELSGYLHSAQGRAAWDVYHLVGDVVRTPELAVPVSAGLHARFAAALEAEAPIVAARRRSPGKRFMTRYGFPGLAAAAAVASVTWIAQPYFGGQNAGVQYAASAQPAVADSQAVMPVAATVQGVEGPVDVSLGDYLDAHRQMVGRGAIRQVSITSDDSQAGQR